MTDNLRNNHTVDAGFYFNPQLISFITFQNRLYIRF